MPNIEFIQLARPTKSLVKYIQQVGRGLRKNGNKECVILDNVGMYITFGLPDADRDWELYFEGEETLSAFNKNNSTLDLTSSRYDNKVRDLSEGQENMILVQDVILPKSNNDNTQMEISEIKQKKDDSELTQDYTRAYNNRQYSVLSRFFKGKYRIEENEDGYYLCNTKKDLKCFLGKFESHSSGAIKIRKINNVTFLIIRLVPKIKGFEDKEIIIGTLTREGGILRFSSFDRRVIDRNVNI